MQRTYLALAALSGAAAVALYGGAPSTLLANAMPSRAPLGQQPQPSSRADNRWTPGPMALPPPPPPLQAERPEIAPQPEPQVVALDVVPYRP